MYIHPITQCLARSWRTRWVKAEVSRASFVFRISAVTEAVNRCSQYFSPCRKRFRRVKLALRVECSPSQKHIAADSSRRFSTRSEYRVAPSGHGDGVAVTGIRLTLWLVPNGEYSVQPGAFPHRPRPVFRAWNRRSGRLSRTFNAVVASSSPASLTIRLPSSCPKRTSTGAHLSPRITPLTLRGHTVIFQTASRNLRKELTRW